MFEFTGGDACGPLGPESEVTLTLDEYGIEVTEGSSVASLRYVPSEANIIADAPELRRAGKSGRSASLEHHTKLTIDQVTTIRCTTSKTLQELAAEYGVSHETIRAARRATT